MFFQYYLHSIQWCSTKLGRCCFSVQKISCVLLEGDVTGLLEKLERWEVIWVRTVNLGGDGKCWEWLVFAGALLFANRYRLRSTSTTEGHRQPHHESGGGVLWVWGVVKRILVKCSAILTLFPYLNTQCFSTACSLQLDFWDFLPLFYAGFVIFNSIFPLELQGKIIK